MFFAKSCCLLAWAGSKAGTCRKDWLRNPALWLVAHLVNTRASFPSRMLPALNPLPYRPMALQHTWKPWGNTGLCCLEG